MSVAAWQCWAAASTVALGELGPDIVGTLPVPQGTGEEDASGGASPALDQPPQPAGCQALRTPCRVDWSNGQPETGNFWRSTALALPCRKPSSPCLEAGPLYHSRCEGGSAPVSVLVWISGMLSPAAGHGLWLSPGVPCCLFWDGEQQP